ncbi:LysM peptidoglycan-binding domain-containing protein [Pseudoduganella lutea]|uniref:DUF3380 domain-containing protein n=1 Tax=Pseudoduganella lutea TaxID=321985 RepID=A0A4P6L2T7_9BURK|nr:N-acetylmuramidase domain-containing protein [Pseudoduganella lutea]QBE65946.1 DUF3380 domain-containing protein [Pseudoduganella lutea]
MRDVHPVAPGETLTRIGQINGRSVKFLLSINDIPNPNRLRIGQKIYLKKELVLGVRFLLQDGQRDPIRDLGYQIYFNKKVARGRTGPEGLTQQIFTDAIKDEVVIYVERLDKSWKPVGKILSGPRNKLVSVTTDRLKLDGKALPHPQEPVNKPLSPKEPVKPAFDPKKPQSPATQPLPGPKTTPTTTPDGKPLTIVEGEIPNVDFLDVYDGTVMTEADYEWAAKELGVELAAIKAFAKVESGGAGFLAVGKRTVPKILYERHKFSAATKHQYSSKYPDISLPTAYYNAKARYVKADAAYKKKRNVPDDVDYYRPVSKKDSAATKAAALSLEQLLKSGAATKEKDKYIAGAGSYKRLLKAYQLDQDAAIESCSWGAFQIMGEYWKTMRYESAKDFSRKVSRSPREQMRSFILYIKYVSPKIVTHLKNLDWAAVAAAYNGPRYKDNAYDVKLAEEYKKFKGK